MLKRILINFNISLIISVIIYFISINFLCKIPSPTGIGYAEITYQIGMLISSVVGIVSFIILMILNKPKEK